LDISGLISASGDSIIKSFPDAGTFRGWISKRLAEELLSTVPNTTQLLIRAHAEAFDELASLSTFQKVDLQSTKYQELLAKKLNEKLADPLKSAAKNLLLTSGGLGDNL
jgi:hypothetical protein